MCKNKRFLGYFVVAFLSVSNVFFPHSTSAEEIDSLKQKKQDVQQERQSIDRSIDNNNEKIDSIIAQQNDLTAQIKKLDKDISNTDKEIKSVNGNIKKTNENISKLTKDIEILKEKLEKRAALLEDRARAFQTNGGFNNYLEVILNAENFADLINRLTAVSTLVQADRDIIDEQNKEQDSLKQKEQEVREELVNLETQKKELDQFIASLGSQKEQKNELINSLTAQQKEIEQMQVELEEKSSKLYELEKGIEESIIAEQARLVELAKQKDRERKAAEEQRQKAASTKPQHASGSASTPVSEGSWTAPAYGVFTTEFGYDVLNGTSRYHYGMDIAAARGTSIVAAADGYVTNASYSSSYGNWVIITHSINGQTFTTVYAHMDSLSVSHGQYVEKGQYLGGMGNTGYSFGNHLHFELHEGNWNNAKSNAVNPRIYISF